ncbi:MAG: AtzE family amidohydrolase [Actinomycetota bacterium]|nr:AtzE family amidohydrolase [Actinomycetota bacterium]
MLDRDLPLDGVTIAGLVRGGEIKATDVAEQALHSIAAGDGEVNSFTSVLAERARRDAHRVDAQVAAGLDPGPLAGVPVAVKNLFDVAGEVTLAGSRINQERPPARADAAALARLTEAGAVLVGSLNMDEYAYGFTTENSHYGPCRNPHDLTRVAGGSSGGSGAAVAADFVPLTLGSDTNGSVRIPAALCGVFGLKPTYGRISRRGMFPFCSSLDHVGVLARSVRDLAVSFDVLRGHDPEDPATRSRRVEPTAGRVDLLRLAVADDYFARGGTPEAFEAVAAVAEALGIDRRVTIPEAGRARSAAMVITASEGADLHRQNLRTRPGEFDPMTRDRFLAGALVPASAYLIAQRFRRWFRAEVGRVLETADVVVAPATPFPAPLIGQREAVVEGETVLTQPYLGCYTQPLSFVGLPVISVPVGDRGLPLGVQLIAAPYREAVLFRVAAELERRGVCTAPVARPWK